MVQKYISSFLGKFLLFVFVIVLTLLSSCRADSGDQCFDNRTDEPIDLYIDGFFELTIDEDEEACIFFGDGCFDWYVEGIFSGYYLEGTFCVGGGGFYSTIVIE